MSYLDRRAGRQPPARFLVAVAAGLLGAWVIKLVRLTRSVMTYGQYWSTSSGTPGGLVYVALGDSAAQGIGASQPERSYVGRLAEKMRERSGCEVLVVNLSMSGATVRDVVDAQLPRLLAMPVRPDIITVAVGGNDILLYSADRFA
ncbi:MAG: SGNH/GDSL hydrolase family protein [Actinomycetota bacterium]|nr:SGNH/GDSL hydrolase family protein [Actinomycetota bacterium]